MEGTVLVIVRSNSAHLFPPPSPPTPQEGSGTFVGGSGSGGGSGGRSGGGSGGESSGIQAETDAKRPRPDRWSEMSRKTEAQLDDEAREVRWSQYFMSLGMEKSAPPSPRRPKEVDRAVETCPRWGRSKTLFSDTILLLFLVSEGECPVDTETS